MHERDDRLVRCFLSVFELSADQARVATTESVPTWDSLATMMLVAVIEEEFGVEVGLPDLREFGSFHSCQDYLSRRGVL
jgi:acyl carrier protein